MRTLATVAADSHPVPIDEHIPCYPASTTLNLRFDVSAYSRSGGMSMMLMGDGSWKRSSQFNTKHCLLTQVSQTAFRQGTVTIQTCTRWSNPARTSDGPASDRGTLQRALQDM